MRKFFTYSLTRRVPACGAVFLLIILLSYSCRSVPKPPDPIAKGDYDEVVRRLSNMIERQMREHNVIGLSIALVDEQETVWAKGFGYADLEQKIPATENTVYRVASISKPFTATAVMQLADQNKIDIDEPLSTYIPGFSIKSRFPGSDAITSRNLMTHHSGVPNIKAAENLEDLVQTLKDEFAAFPPNFVHSYSNVGFGLLGRMIELMAGEEFTSYMDETILKPIGMNLSSFVLRDDIEESLSKGYFKGKEGLQIPSQPQYVPAGALYSTAVDLSRYLHMVFNEGSAGTETILSPESLAEMFRPQNEDIPLDLDFRFGLSWFLLNLKGIVPEGTTIVAHGGRKPLFRSAVRCLPDMKIGVVLLTNSVEGDYVRGPITAQALKLMYEAKTGNVVEGPAPLIPAPVASVSANELKKYEGYYETDEGFQTVSLRGKKLITEVYGKKSAIHSQGRRDVYLAIPVVRIHTIKA